MLMRYKSHIDMENNPNAPDAIVVHERQLVSKILRSGWYLCPDGIRLQLTGELPVNLSKPTTNFNGSEI